jgi:hypothetical protein
MKYFFLIFFSLSLSFSVFTQTDKKIETCITLFDKDPFKAVAKLKKYLNKAGDESRPEAWDIYVEMRETIYNSKLQAVGVSLEYFLIQKDFERLSKLRDSVLTLAELGSLTAAKEEEVKSMIYQIDGKLSDLDQMAFEMYSVQYNQYIYAMREATLRSRSVRADANLRALFFTYEPDTVRVDTADITLYTTAYESINQGKLEEGKILLDSLIQAYPTSYNVNMSYYLYHYFKEEADSAKFYLKKSIELFPDVIEPRENLAKILFGEGNIYRAREQVEVMFSLYQGQDMKSYLSEVLFLEDKKLNDRRINRPVFPNQIGIDTKLQKDHWADYQEAKLKVSPFTESTGLIKENDITKTKYLEIYSWQRMLDKNRNEKPEELAFAYEMEEEGLLDCYVFFSNFHIDFAAQTEHFSRSKENRERMISFVNTYLVELAG